MLFLTELTILIKSVSNAINLLLMVEIALKCVNLNSAHKFRHLRVGDGKAREGRCVCAARSPSAKSKSRAFPAAINLIETNKSGNKLQSFNQS